MITIQVQGIKATLDVGVWKSGDVLLLSELQSIAGSIDVPAYVPSSDGYIARHAIVETGGEIVSEDEIDFDDELVY